MSDPHSMPKIESHAGKPPRIGPISARMIALRAWLRETLQPENVLAGLRTFAWVAPLTILIWIYAEREQINPDPGEVPIPIAVKSIDPTRIVRLRAGEETVTAKLVGPNAAVQRVTEEVRRSSDDPAIQIDVDRRFAPNQEVTIDTAQYIGSNPLFRNNGIVVRDCKPSNLHIFVDELAERDVEVRVPDNVTNLAGPPVFEPRTVRVRGPRSVLENTKHGRLEVFAQFLDRDELRSPGTHTLAGVPLVCSVDDPSITIGPATVNATVAVSQSNVRYEIQSMPIWVVAQPGVLDKYKVEYNNVIANVTVVGPPDTIDQLKKENFEPRPKARLEITLADIGKPMQERQLRFDLPKGVEIAPEDEARCKVSFRLVDLAQND